jgi:hypothetical protein
MSPIQRPLRSIRALCAFLALSALPGRAAAQIIYQNIPDTPVPPNESVEIDVDGDGATDLTFHGGVDCFAGCVLWVEPRFNAGVTAFEDAGQVYAEALTVGTAVSGELRYSFGGSFVRIAHGGIGGCLGIEPWCETDEPRFFGVTIERGPAAWYAWVRARNPAPGAIAPSIIIMDMAYRTTPGPIVAGAGDLNCDAAIDAFDIEPFLLALLDPGGYAERYPNCHRLTADINADGAVDAFDIEPFVDLLLGP